MILKLVDVDSSISDTIEESIKKLNEDIKCINEEIAIDREKSNELISNNNIFSWEHRISNEAYGQRGSKEVDKKSSKKL